MRPILEYLEGRKEKKRKHVRAAHLAMAHAPRDLARAPSLEKLEASRSQQSQQAADARPSLIIGRPTRHGELTLRAPVRHF